MTHLRIEQNNGVIEEVSSSVITKLYEIAHAGLNVSSNLLGRLHSTIGIRSLIQELTTTYPDLYINVDDYVIEFEDPKVVAYLNSIGVGSNGIVTEALAAAATVAANSLNTEITKFNELRYFTNITTSKGGYTGYQSGNIRFMNWTALEEIDISNFTSIGHRTTNGYEDTFSGCSSLKKVTASDNLTTIGFAAFRSCSNLELITGLSGVIKIASQAFLYCSKLTDESIKNVAFEPDPDSSYIAGACFEGTLFTEIKISSDTTFIPFKAFRDCNKLERIIGGNIITISGEAFKNCSKLTSFDFSNVEQIDKEAFRSCDLTGTLSIPNLKTLSGDYIFSNNTHLSAVNIDWSNLTNSGPTDSMFRSCTALPTIDLTGAKVIRNSTFRDCSNLTTITGLSNCELIKSGAFWNCSHLTTIDLSNVETIEQLAFYGCSGLTSVNLSSLSSAGSQIFYGCNNIQTVTLTKNCENISNSLFDNQDIQSITTVNVSDTELWSSFNKCVFPSYGNTCPYDVLPFSNATTGRIAELGLCARGSSSIYQLYLPKLQTASIEFSIYNRINPLLGVYSQGYLSLNCRFKTRLLYLKDVQTLKENCFAGLVCNALVINNTTPPACTTLYHAKIDEYRITATDVNIDTWGNIENASDPTLYPNSSSNYANYNYNDGKLKTLLEIDNIYVPDSAVNTYKTTSGWSVVASKIKGISELNGGVTYPTKAAWEAAGKPLALIDEYM